MTELTTPRLSRAEWQAVSIALKDAADCGCAVAPEQGTLRARIARIYGAITGAEARTPLADARLEAIRRFVCETRRTRRAAERHVPDLFAQGFSSDQIAALALLSA